MRFKFINISIIILSLVLLNGCAIRPKGFYPLVNYRSSTLSSINLVKISNIQMTGDLQARKINIYSPFSAGFNKQNKTINLFDSENNALNYYDGELKINIHATSSVSFGDKIKYVPLLNATANFVKSFITYDWDVLVNYDFLDVYGKLLKSESFNIHGSHDYKQSIREMTLSNLTGIALLASRYPDEESISAVGDMILGVTGEEIAKRLSAEPIRSYLIAREKQRDGMDIKTYVDFLDKKKRLEKDREIVKVQRLKDLDVSVKHKGQLSDIKSGTVMVLGIGVSKYQSTQIPSLRFADSDSQRVVHFFKNRYQLSDDRAMLLTNEDATAIKISRFITNNVMKLLDKEDTFIFYFGGHGAPDVDDASIDNDGLKKYLLLHDSDLNSLPMTALSLNNLATLLGKLPCKRILILLDSCFAGTAGVQTLSKLKSISISERSYKNITELSGEGRVILAASSENQVSHEDDKLQAGVFTHYLLSGLNGNADMKSDGEISLLGLYEYVAKEVSKRTDNKQTPVFRGTLDANIIF